MAVPEYNEFVADKEIKLLPLPIRLAWAATVCERVLRLFSPYFRERYHQAAALDLVWAFIDSGKYDTSECDRLVIALQDIEDDAADAGYSFDIIYPPRALLFELNQGKAVFARQAVSYASIAFAYHQGFRQGISLDDPVVPGDYYLLLSVPVYDFSRQLFDCLKTKRRPAPARDWFGDLQLETSFQPLPAKVLTKKTTAPPAKEAAYIRRLYGKKPKS